MADRLGHPETDPHGHPIPDLEGRLPRRHLVRLDLLDAGQTARITEVRDHDPALLRHLAELGLVPGRVIRVMERAPFGGILTLDVEGETRRLGLEAGASLHVTPLPSPPAVLP